jgi:hypothetical protein
MLYANKIILRARSRWAENCAFAVSSACLLKSHRVRRAGSAFPGKPILSRGMLMLMVLHYFYTRRLRAAENVARPYPWPVNIG